MSQISKVPGEGIKELETTILTHFTEKLNLSPNIIKFCNNSDFALAFTEKIIDIEEQKKYLLNSSKYDMGKGDYNANYVLFFRRTLPSIKPKPEEHWTNNFIIVTNGLRREIPEGPHRLHSIILCDTLAHIKSNGGNIDQRYAFSDGEIIVNFPEY